MYVVEEVKTSSLLLLTIYGHQAANLAGKYRQNTPLREAL
jgi:hypothetical protein